MKTEVCFHEGLKGSGVVVSVTHGKDRVVFDFGAPFRPDQNPYDGTVRHRSVSALKDALRLKETPPLDGVYSKRDLLDFPTSIQPYEESELNTAVLISHLHLDHMSNICFLDESIPVYMHKRGKRLLEALDKINEGTPHQRIVGVEYGEVIEWGTLRCTPYFSDHPCWGSAGYLIEAPDSTIYYTGDIRYHGLQKERAFEEIEKLADIKIDLLIVDGTSYSPSKFKHDASKIDKIAQPNRDILPGMFLEASVYEDLYQKLKASKDLGLFSIYHRDMQLIEALIEHAEKAGRTVVFEVETAFIINQVLDRAVCFYVPDTPQDLRIVEAVRERNQEWTTVQINAEPDKMLVQVSYKNIMTMLSLNTKKGWFFHLFAEPFGTGNKACRIFEAMLKKAEVNLVSYSNVYSFNHAFPNHLSYVIDTIKPIHVVAVHSNVPEKLNAMKAKAILPKQNVPYVFEQETLVEKNSNKKGRH